MQKHKQKQLAGGRQKISSAVCTTGISQYACHHHHTNNYHYIRKSLLSCSRDCYFRDGDGGGVGGVLLSQSVKVDVVMFGLGFF